VQTIIDFIAGAFIDCGNVISYWYANTGAITVNAILIGCEVDANTAAFIE
jgi:hypothetical protein